MRLKMGLYLSLDRLILRGDMGRWLAGVGVMASIHDVGIKKIPVPHKIVSDPVDNSRDEQIDSS